MRHRKKKVNVLQTWQQKKSIVIRNLFTSLLSNGQIKTTKHKAFVLKSYANNIFAKIIKLWSSEDWVKESIRLVKSIVFGNDNWKKLINDIMPKLLESPKTTFISDYKLGFRKWDWTEEVLIKIDY